MPRESYYLPSRRLVSQDDAAIIQRTDVPRSRFLGAWTRKTAFDAGYLVPILCEEVLPGDHLTYNITAYVRMSTPLFPLFDNQRVDTFFFFVPNRLVWTNWVRFMGEQPSPGDSINFTIPQIVSPVGGSAVGSIYDHFTIPVEGQISPAEDISFSALPFRAYNLIYHTWFRDQNIINAPALNTNDGPDSSDDYVLRLRAKAHDRFTSALPWPQKFTAPTIPLAGTAPVTGIGIDGTSGFSAGPLAVYETGYTGSTVNYDYYLGGANIAADFVMKLDGTPKTPQVFADLSEATGVAINTLRQAWMVQSLLERDARGGTRYVELIRSHFGVTNPDFRLQRPEYIGGGQTPLTLTPIAQTAPTETLPVGALGAAGTAAGQHRASYAATEHGWIIGLINVRSEQSYQQGLHKKFTRLTRVDHYFPAMAGLGEQAILRQELWATGVAASDAAIFGYQERWHEYRANESEVVGIMRSSATGTLDAWHLAQYHTDPPTLSQGFIEDIPPMERVLAAGEEADGQQYLADILYQRNAVRPIPLYGTPVQIGRF